MNVDGLIQFSDFLILLINEMFKFLDLIRFITFS